MKGIVWILYLLPVAVYAASCHVGYVSVENLDVVVADTCPTGYVSVGVADSCSDGGGGACWDVAPVRELCDIGISNIKTSTGVSIPLYAVAYTVPAINVGYNGGVCYANLAAGQSDNAINVRYNGVVYHAVE